MENEKKKVSELDISDLSKQILTLSIKKTYMISLVAKLNKSYNYINTQVRILVEKGYMKRYKTASGKILYQLNTDVIEP